ncbi:MAG: hypothetical protein RR603_01370 [Kurthia sp.]
MPIKVWTIAINKAVSGPVEPVFYYNHVNDVWGREFKGGCAFFDEKSCDEKLEELNIFGAEKVSGSVD